MAWIVGNRSKGWMVAWREGGRGTKPSYSEAFAVQSDALEEKRRIEKELEAKKDPRRPFMSGTIEDLLARWRAHGLKERLFSEHWAREVIRDVLRLAIELEWKTIADINEPDLQEWRERRLPDLHGVAGPLRSIKCVVSWAKIIEKLPLDPEIANVGKKVRKMTPRPKPDLLTDDQAFEIWRRSYDWSDWAGTTIEHLLLYPCRPVDASRLKVGDWDPIKSIITYRATKNGQDVRHWVHPGHARKLTALCAGRGPTEFLFHDAYNQDCWEIRWGKAYGLKTWYRNHIGKKMHAVGLIAANQVGVYRLKNYAMTRLSRAAGGDRSAVASVSGHADEEMVDVYEAWNLETQERLLLKIPEFSKHAVSTGS